MKRSLLVALLLLGGCAEALEDSTPTTVEQSMVHPPDLAVPTVSAVDSNLQVAEISAASALDPTAQLEIIDASATPIRVEARPSLTEIAALPQAVSFGAVGMRVHDVDGAIVVRDVLDEMPAAEAGVEPGMQVIAVDGMSVDGVNVRTFVQLVRGEPGESVELTVVDATGGEQTIVVARERYETERTRCERIHDLRRQTEFGGIGARMNGCAGVTVASVEEGSPAEAAGLQAGDRIIGVDGLNAEGAHVWDVIGQVRGEPGESVVLDVTGDDGQLRTLSIERVPFVLPETGSCGR